MNKRDIQKQATQFVLHSRNSTKLQEQRDRAIKNQDFYRGHQWTKEEWERYKNQGVNPITVNRCLALVRVLSGMQQQNKQELRVRPRKGATESAANIHTSLLQHTEDLSDAQSKYSKMFELATSQGEAYLKAVIDKERNPNGQLILEAKSLSDVDVDPDAKEYDIDETAKYVVENYWLDKDVAQIRYQELEGRFEGAMSIFRDDDDPNGIMSYLYDDDISLDEERRKYRIRMREVWWKEVVEGLLVIDHQEKLTKVISDKKKIADIKRKAKKSTRFEIEPRPTKKLHKTVMAGTVMVEDTVNPFGDEVTRFPYFRFAPHWDEGYAFGILDNVISLNQEENINRTQMTKMLNQTVNSGYKVGGGSQKKKQELANYGSADGLVIDVSDYSNMVERIQPNKLSPGHAYQAEMFEQDQKRVSGLDDAIHGYEDDKNESGRAIFLKQKQARVGTEPIFSNFYYTLRLWGKFAIDVIRKQRIYTDEEIKEVVSESALLDDKMLQKAKNQLVSKIGTDLPQPMQPQTKPEQVLQMARPEDKPQVLQTIKTGVQAAQMYLEKYPQLKEKWNEIIKFRAIEMLMEQLRDDNIREYGIKVTLSPEAPTVRMSNLIEMDSIQEKYGIIPPDVYIDATDLPNKDEIKSRIQQQQNQAQQQQPQQAQTG